MYSEAENQTTMEVGSCWLPVGSIQHPTLFLLWCIVSRKTKIRVTQKRICYEPASTVLHESALDRKTWV